MTHEPEMDRRDFLRKAGKIGLVLGGVGGLFGIIDHCDRKRD